MTTYFDKPQTATGRMASAFKPRPTGFLLTALVAAIAAITLATASTAVAQTPDGETPANEGVCDVLQADGTTKGLYGLCVAFCEAHDATDIDEAITNNELEDLLMSSPNGRILKNYNRKKTDADPDMPCVKVQEPCPCWTAEQTLSIDGVMSDGSPANIFFSRGEPLSIIYESGNTPNYESNEILSYENHGGAEALCQRLYFDKNTTPWTIEHVRLYYYGAGNPNNSLTAQQHLACRASVEEVQARNGF